MSMNRKPPELHIVDGTRTRTGNTTMLPDSIKKRIPAAEWLNSADAWDKERFVKETADFLFTVYGIGNDQDKHTLAMLANQMEIYIKAQIGIEKGGLVTKFNDGRTLGPNPYLTVANKSLTLIVQLMNELGLTPRSRLSAGKVEENSAIAEFLRGPLG